MTTDNLPPLPEPFDYCYEWSAGEGVHRSFSSWPWNGMKPERAVAVYTATQVEEIRRAAVLAERERFRAMFDEALADHGITWPGEVDILYEKMFPAAAIREGVK
jgi:hypothetical protein